ncbi:MAG TPA: alpha/beta hydrolase [Longimicrobiales bacterium]
MTSFAGITDSFVAAGGACLRSRRWEAGEPRGRVLLVHGLGEHGGRWGHVARFLAGRGFGVFSYDQRGHGASEGARGHLPSFDVLLDDLRHAQEELERRLPGEGPPFLYGHSMGGLVVIRYVQSYGAPSPGVVLSAPWLGTAMEVPGWKRLAARLLTRFAPEVTLTTDLEASALSRDPGVQRAYDSDPLVHRRLSPRLFAQVEQAQALALEQGLHPSVPALVLVPEDDPITDVGLTLRWAGSLPGGQVRVLRLAGLRHEPHNEPEGESVLASVVEWLEGLRA